MKRQDLIAAVAASTNLDAADAGRAVDAVFDTIATALATGHEVRLSDFGTFHVTHRAATSGRNPRTGEPMQVEARNQPKFTAGRSLRDAVR